MGRGVDGSLTLDLLELDREERFEEVTQLRRMIALSDSYEQHAYTLVQRNVGEPGRAERDFKRGAVTGVFANESAELMSAREKELHFAHIFKLEAARRLVDATHKVFEEALVGHTLKIAKILFRHLRVPLLKKRSIYMKHRAILKNYIRICKRLTSLSESVYKYQLKRKQWVALNRWIKLLEMSYLETTPGLILRLKRGVAMYRRFSDSLADQGFSVTVRSSIAYTPSALVIALCLRSRSALAIGTVVCTARVRAGERSSSAGSCSHRRRGSSA